MLLVAAAGKATQYQFEVLLTLPRTITGKEFLSYTCYSVLVFALNLDSVDLDAVILLIRN